MKNKCLFSALLLTFSFLLEPSSTIVNASNNNIYLNDAKDIIELSEKCSYDAYSKDKIFILNNFVLGKISETQFKDNNGRFVMTTKNSGYTVPDFVKIGEAYGIKSFLLNTYEDLEN